MKISTYLDNIFLIKNTKWAGWLLNVMSSRQHKITVCTNYQLLPNFFLIQCFALSKNFTYLTDLLVFDTIYKYWRFEITILLTNCYNFLNLCIKQKIMEAHEVTSLVFWYKNASWIEREIWELFGIKFFLNSNLGRLLLDYNYKGFPFRKDFYYEGYNKTMYILNKHEIHLFL